MRRYTSFKRGYAVSEIVGGMILVLIAVITFSLVYVYLFPSGPDHEASVKIEGAVNEEGIVLLEHVGGNILDSYKIIITYPNGTLIGSKTYTNDQWKIGEHRYPLDNITDIKLLNESYKLDIMVYSIHEDGSEEQIFIWEASGLADEIPPPDLEDPMLISSLRSDTTDEDLICYNYSIIPQIDALTFIYNWTINGNPIMDLLMPFDTDSSDTTRDYSGDNTGTLFGPTWVNSGVVGGCYQFDGINNYISLPYCYDSGYIDEITVETWIKTSSNNMVLASYDHDDYWELGIRNGVIKWTTTANSVTTSIYGVTNVNDDAWHHIAVTYDSSFGDCAIYVDGNNDINTNCHNPAETIGSGTNPNGFIGTGNIGIFPGVWDLLTYDDFEDGFGNYTDGGRDCILYTDGTYAHQGSNSANIQDDNGWESSFYHTNGIDVDTPGYTSIKVDFWWMRRGDYWDWGSDEDWWVRYYDGNTWNTVLDVNYPGGYSQNTWYNTIVYINETDYTFPSNMKIRFQCDATSDYDDVYIDQVFVTATLGEITISNYSGFVDEFHIYNRALSGEQVFQNYLCTRDGLTDKSVIVSDETLLGDIWRCIVTPNDSIEDDVDVQSNILQIVGYGGG